VSVTSIHLSPLESAVLTVFYELYGDRGFPPPTAIRVQRRQNTGAGRFVDVEAAESVDLDDGTVDLGGRFIEMKGVPNGLMAVAHITNRHLRQIEFAVYGNEPWDGQERPWSIL
jgi:hypothetical protein